MKTLLFLMLGLAVGIGLVFLDSGCADSHVSSASRQSIQSGHDAAAVNAAKVQDAGTVADAKGVASPVTHPIAAANKVVKETRASLRVIFLAAFIVLGISVGLMFTSLSLLSKIAAPVAGSVALLSLAGEIALPFFPWLVLIGALAIGGIAAYEVIRAGSISTAISAVEADAKAMLGIAAPAVAPVTVPPAGLPITPAKPA